MLIDPRNKKPPDRVFGRDMANLVLFKIVRYHRISYADIEQTSRDFDIRRRYVEVCSNVTDFKIEYAVENRFSNRGTRTADFPCPVRTR